MGYLKLLLANPRTIGFGFLNTFFSGLGQTHFVAIFSPVIMTAFSLSSTEYGGIYSLVTLVSGFVITFLGPLIDRFDARYFAAFIGLGLLVSEALIFPMSSLPMVAIGLFGLRLFGQGLCSSLSSISIARYFNEGRGKALSLSQLGFPVYEGLITPLGAFALLQFGHQTLLLALSLAILVIFIPFTWTMTAPLPAFNKVSTHHEEKVEQKQNPQKSWSRRQVFRDKTVYLLIPQVLMPPFTLTGVFFHQAIIAEQKGWSLKLMASGLFFFAIGRILNTFITGPLVDKHSARKLFAWYQIPLSVGFVILSLFSQHWIPAVCFFLFGLTVGSGGPIKSAIWAELYGVKHLGAIKSLFATFMILSTAASPALFGWLIDHFASAKPLLLSLTVLSLVSALMAAYALAPRRAPRALA